MRHPYVKLPDYKMTCSARHVHRLPTDTQVRDYIVKELQEAHLFANGNDLGEADRERWEQIGDEIVAEVIGDDEIMAAVKSLAVSLVMDHRRELYDAFRDRMARELAEEWQTELRELLAGDGGAMPVAAPTVDDAHLGKLVDVVVGVGGGAVRDGLQVEGLSAAEAAEAGLPVGGMEAVA